MFVVKLKVEIFWSPFVFADIEIVLETGFSVMTARCSNVFVKFEHLGWYVGMSAWQWLKCWKFIKLSHTFAFSGACRRLNVWFLLILLPIRRQSLYGLKHIAFKQREKILLSVVRCFTNVIVKVFALTARFFSFQLPRQIVRNIRLKLNRRT